LSRKKGSSGDSQKYDSFSLTVLWITIVVFISLGIFIKQFNFGTINIYSSIVHYLGLFLIIFGLVIRWFAIHKLKEFFSVTVSIQKDHRIVDTGIYKYIRHPAYLGSLLSFLNLDCALQNWLTIVVIFFPIFSALIYRIHVEEKVLNLEFREAYSDYSSHTKKLIPWIY